MKAFLCKNQNIKIDLSIIETLKIITSKNKNDNPLKFVCTFKTKKDSKLELNYKYLLLGIAILTLLLVPCRQSGWSLIGGVSKKQAEKNFSDFLTKNYPNELAFTNLKRFFNEGNMNPNMFSVEVYQINRPEITFVTFFDAKKIVGAKDIASDYLDGPSFDQLYKQEIAHMEHWIYLESS